MKTPTLISHWPLNQNADDVCGRHGGVARNVTWTAGPGKGAAAAGAAVFNGRDSVVEVADAPGLQLGGADFTLSAWVRCAKPMRGAFGDVISKFDEERRCGLNVWVSGGSAGYASQSDARHVHAGIDDGYLGEWQSNGRPGTDNPLVSALTTFRGELYAGVTDSSKPAETAKVHRWAGGTDWVDCGRLGNNPEHLGVMSMIVHDGALYAGTGLWDWGKASAASKTTPPTALAHVFRYEGGTTWRDLGQVGRAQRVLCMASFNGELYAGLDRGGASGKCFKLVGESWVQVGELEPNDNWECLMPVGGVLYGASHFAVYRYDGGAQWTKIADRPFDIEQIHSFQVMHGKLWIGTWPQGYILRHEGGDKWTNTGLVGLNVGKPGVARINEVNALGVHNGKMYAGVLPKAQVYRYDADNHWTLMANLATRADWNPGVLPSWARVLSFTTHKGLLFTCTGACQARVEDIDPDLTTGRVLSCQTGTVASHEHDISDAWTHVTMVRRNRDVRLYINGELSHRSPAPRRFHFDLGNAEPLKIGAGVISSFDGAISDVRLYNGAMSDAQVRKLAL